MSAGERHAASHASPQGPGDARPSALQIVRDENLEDGLTGLTALITGGNTGIGFEVARAMLATGAQVVITARNAEKGSAAVNELSKGNPTANASFLEMEMSSLRSVRAAARKFKEQYNQLNILINNAGMAGADFARTEDGLELHMAVNHFAHFMLFSELKDLLLASSTPEVQSRVICVSSGVHTGSTVDVSDLEWQKRTYNGRLGYMPSKTANIWMAREIEARYGHKGLHAWSVSPGLVRTGLPRSLPHQTVDDFYADIEANENMRAALQSPAQGAAAFVWAAITREHEGGRNGGLYLTSKLEAVPVPASTADRGSADSGKIAPHAYNEQGAQALWAELDKVVAAVPA